MIPVKICGITNLEDARMAVRNGARAIGFIFYDKSPRHISVEAACQIAADIQGEISLVGVFVNESLENVQGAAEEVGLNFIQLHGNESPKYCQDIQLPVIKVFRTNSSFNVGIINSYDVHAFLFDTYKKDKLGGTGKIFNWDIIINLKTDTPIILSGGLNIKNIERGIDVVFPSAVDINSGVESSPGIKDEKKMISIFDILKNTQNVTNPFEIPVIQGGQS